MTKINEHEKDMVNEHGNAIVNEYEQWTWNKYENEHGKVFCCEQGMFIL